MRLDIPIRAARGEEWSTTDAPLDPAARLRELGVQPPRRANRLMQMALVGAVGCLGDRTPAEGTGLALASSHGNVADTVRMVQGIVEHGHSPMPMDFINVSTNMACFQVAHHFGMRGGPSLMVSRGGGSLAAALELAVLEPTRPWLVGVVEEAVWPLATHRRRLRLEAGESLAEASYWIWLDPEAGEPVGGLRSMGWHPDAGTACRALGEEIERSDHPFRLALGATVSAGEVTPRLPNAVRLHDPPGSGYHLARFGRVLCGHLMEDTEAALAWLDRDPVSGRWLLICFSAGAASR